MAIFFLGVVAGFLVNMVGTVLFITWLLHKQ